MTVTEYRKKHPNCRYCEHESHWFGRCRATLKRMTKRTAKKCPCYKAKQWFLDKP